MTPDAELTDPRLIEHIVGDVRAYLVATLPATARTTHDAVRALLLLTPIEDLDGLAPAAQEAAIRRTIRALDRYVSVD